MLAEDDYFRVFGKILQDVIIERGCSLDDLWEKPICEVFPPRDELDDIVGYATDLHGNDTLIRHGTGSFSEIYVNQKSGHESAGVLSGLRQAFNGKAEELDVKLRLYALGMPRRHCDIVGNPISTFDYFNLFVDLTERPQPTTEPKPNHGMSKPEFLYFNGAHLALPFWGFSSSKDPIWNVVNRLAGGYKELLALPKKVYVEPLPSAFVAPFDA